MNTDFAEIEKKLFTILFCLNDAKSNCLKLLYNVEFMLQLITLVYHLLHRIKSKSLQVFTHSNVLLPVRKTIC